MKLASLIGLFSAMTSGGALVIFTTYMATSGQVKSSTSLILIVLAVLSVIAGWTAVKQKPLLLMLVFLVSFVPLGMYLMLMPSWVRIAGLAQVGYAVAAMMMMKERKAGSAKTIN